MNNEHINQTHNSCVTSTIGLYSSWVAVHEHPRVRHVEHIWGKVPLDEFPTYYATPV